jgi:biopolymer transport protein ExbD
MANSSISEDGDVGFQIAPMVDVVFVLLLFFMAAAGSQVIPKELSINLPGGTDGCPVITPIFVDIAADGQVRINSKIVDASADKQMPELREWLKDAIYKFGDKDPVILRPHPQARQERIIDVLNAAATSGVKNLTFS